MQIALQKVRLNRMHRKLDWHLRRNEKIFQEAIQKWFALTIKQIQSDLTKKFIKDITSELTDWQYLKHKGQEILKPAALSLMKDGGDTAYDILKIEGSFDVLNVMAVEAAEKFVAELVREVNDQTRKGIRVYIADGIKEGKSMDKVARELRPLVGLTEGQTESVMNYHNLLSEKYPALTTEDINRKVQKYADKTHRRRTQTIARTETARAQNLGYVESLEDVGIKEVEFSAYPGCCDVCDSMNSKKYSIGRASDIIPVHPNCRCAMLPVVE